MPSCGFSLPIPRGGWLSAPIWPMRNRVRTAPNRPISVRRSARADLRIITTGNRRTSLMYDYTDFDERFVRERVAQFSQQVERRLDGSLTEEEFRPLRLMNGLYLQLH